jgi:uncharacterized protein (TIGR00255 family)
MIYSMTGFGKGEVQKGGFRYTVEVKSVNHRYCEVSIRSSRELSLLDEHIKGHIRKKLERGKIDVAITQDVMDEADLFEVDISSDIAAKYLEAARDICSELGLENNLKASDLLLLPEVVKIEKKREDMEELFSVLSSALDEAIEGLLDFRSKEGERLRADIAAKILAMLSDVDSIEKLSVKMPLNYKTMLEARIKEYLAVDKIDEQRIAQEVAIYADKCCIDEELVRLRGHLEHFGKEMEKGGRLGRKLDFMTQEINREINTIGSKTCDIEITKTVVELKSILEQIREQVQNIE